MLRVIDVLNWVDSYAPFRYAASWDRCGLQVGNPDASVERILVALDPTAETIEEAVENGCQCLVTHHPLLFRPLNNVRTDEFPGNLVATALVKGVHLIAAHTNLDAAAGGTNDQLAALLSLEDVTPLEADPSWSGEGRYAGMGKVGRLPWSMRLGDFVERIREAFEGIAVRAAGDPEREIRRIAICTGSGGSLIETVIACGCDAYVTGDLKYHEAQRAVEANLSLIDMGHFASERPALRPLATYLQTRAVQEGCSAEVLVALKEKDPFWTRGGSRETASR